MRFWCALILHLGRGSTMTFAGEVICNRCGKVTGWWR